jgi:TfoX/Sxy family transcriptional regulator of competence genes
MAWRKAPPQLVSLFDSAIPRDPRVERRLMFGYPAAFADGKLFAGLHQESFILKLPAGDRTLLQATHDAPLFEPMPGRRMREYVVLPEVLLSDRGALDHWVSRSLAYVATQASAARTPPRAATARKSKR